MTLAIALLITTILVGCLIVYVFRLNWKRSGEIKRVTGPRVQTTSAEAMRALEKQYEQQRQFEADQVNWP